MLSPHPLRYLSPYPQIIELSYIFNWFIHGSVISQRCPLSINALTDFPIKVAIFLCRIKIYGGELKNLNSYVDPNELLLRRYSHPGIGGALSWDSADPSSSFSCTTVDKDDASAIDRDSSEWPRRSNPCRTTRFNSARIPCHQCCPIPSNVAFNFPISWSFPTWNLPGLPPSLLIGSHF